MRATQKHLAELRKVRDNIQRAVDYLMDDKISGIAHITDNPNGGSYTINNPVLATPNGHTTIKPMHVDVICKEYGSHLVGAYQALRGINAIIEKLEK